MKKWKVTMTVLLAATILLLAGCNESQERKAEKTLATYYEGLIDNDYEQSIEVLYLHDKEDDLYAGTSMAQGEAKEIMKKKMLQLEAVDYRVLSYEISELEYEDDHSFWHHVLVTGEIDGEQFIYEDTVTLVEEQLVITGDDPLIHYRNGNIAE